MTNPINCSVYRNPTPPGEESPQNITWPTAGAEDGKFAYYVLTHAAPPVEALDGIQPLKLTVEYDKFKDRMDFWASMNLGEDQI